MICQDIFLGTPTNIIDFLHRTMKSGHVRYRVSITCGRQIVGVNVALYLNPESREGVGWAYSQGVYVVCTSLHIHPLNWSLRAHVTPSPDLLTQTTVVYHVQDTASCHRGAPGIHV